MRWKNQQKYKIFDERIIRKFAYIPIYSKDYSVWIWWEYYWDIQIFALKGQTQSFGSRMGTGNNSCSKNTWVSMYKCPIEDKSIWTNHIKRNKNLGYLLEDDTEYIPNIKLRNE